MPQLEGVTPLAGEGAEGFYLHPEAAKDGRVVIKDSAGRILRGVRAIKFESSMESANILTITVLSGVDGGMTNQAKPK